MSSLALSKTANLLQSGMKTGQKGLAVDLKSDIRKSKNLWAQSKALETLLLIASQPTGQMAVSKRGFSVNPAFWTNVSISSGGIA